MPHIIIEVRNDTLRTGLAVRLVLPFRLRRILT
jgi:hypothetical protein